MHQKKNLNVEERQETARRLGIPLSDEAAARADFYRPAEDSDEIKYLRNAVPPLAERTASAI